MTSQQERTCSLVKSLASAMIDKKKDLFSQNHTLDFKFSRQLFTTVTRLEILNDRSAHCSCAAPGVAFSAASEAAR